jgi:hypothetical protein
MAFVDSVKNFVGDSRVLWGSGIIFVVLIVWVHASAFSLFDPGVYSLDAVFWDFWWVGWALMALLLGFVLLGIWWEPLVGTSPDMKLWRMLLVFVVLFAVFYLYHWYIGAGV